MTSETQIEAGRELDALIATEVMGWTHDRERAHEVSSADGESWEWVTGWRRGSEEWLHDFPPGYYSTSYEGMGLVLERLQALGWDIDATWAKDIWHVALGSWNNNKAEAPTLPHAVALAALAAVRA